MGSNPRNSAFATPQEVYKETLMKTFWCRNVSTLLRGGVLAVLVGGSLTVGGFSVAAQAPAPERAKLEDIHAAKVDPNVIYGMYSGLALVMDVYHPAQPNGYAVVFVHGGHWRMSPEVGAVPFKDGGNIVQLVQFIKPMISAGYTVFVPEYRMAPRFLPPAEVEDIQRAVRFIRFNAKKYGIDPDHIGGAGFSSGAHIISMVGLLDGKPTSDDLSPAGQVSARIQAVVSGATPANLVETAAVIEDDAFTSGFIGDQVGTTVSPNSPLYKRLMDASPITHVAPGAPPFFLIHADKDTEVPIKIEQEFQQALEKAGVPVKMVVVPDSDHEATFVGDHANVFVPAMIQFLDQNLRGKTK
jgi:acetyl esterase/lipase